MADGKVQIGAVVSFQHGTRTVQGMVKEDRGPLGVKGRHLYLVEFRQGPYAEYVSEIELPAVDLEPVTTSQSLN